MSTPSRKQIVDLAKAWYEAEHKPQAFQIGRAHV